MYPVATFSFAVNFTACQLQRIEALKREGSFSPICKDDGSYSEIQCVRLPITKCWAVDKDGEKVPDSDVTVFVETAQKQTQWPKEHSAGEYEDFAEDEEGGCVSYFALALHVCSSQTPVLRWISNKLYWW